MADVPHPRTRHAWPLKGWIRCGKWLFGVAALLYCLQAGPISALGTWPAARRLAGSGTTVNAQENATAVDLCADEHDRRLGSSSGIPHPLDSMLIMLLIAYTICAALDHCNVLLPAMLRLPISCVIFLAGSLVDYCMYKTVDNVTVEETRFVDLLYGRSSLSFIDPHALFYILLPPLLYESASSQNWHVLKKVLPSSVLLALPGVFVNVGLTACLAKVIVRDPSNERLQWDAVLLLASILSATDPVAVVASLRTLGAPQKLSALIEGESLLNDGSAFVLFLVLKDVVGSSAPDDEKLCPGETPGAGCVVGRFFQLSLGGCLMGVVIGYAVLIWVGYVRFHHFPVLETSIILVAVYGSFFLAERVKMSGVLAVVTFGIMMTAHIKPVLSHEASHGHHNVIEQIGYLCDKLIFFAAGMVARRFAAGPMSCHLSSVPRMVGEHIALYLVLHITRGIVMVLFWPCLRKMGYGFSWKEGCVLVYGGLRGAVGLAMGLMVEHFEYIPTNISMTIAFHTAGIVMLTIVINGSTMEALYKWLKLYRVNLYKVGHITKVLRKLENECEKKGLNVLRKHWYFQDVQFPVLQKCVPIFSNVDCDPAGRPFATDVAGVGQVVNSLDDAASFRSGKSREACVFGGLWDLRHKDLKAEVEEWMAADAASAMAGLKEVGDLLVNVLDEGERTLQHRHVEESLHGGIYISHRPLSQVSVWDESGLFTVTLRRMCWQHIVIGLTSDPPETTEGLTNKPLLGLQENSVGLDCNSGEVAFNQGEGTETRTAGVPLQSGDEVRVKVGRTRGQDWTVVFLMTRGQETNFLASCSIGPFTPDELYPVVEFRHPLECKAEETTSPHGKVSDHPQTMVSGHHNILSASADEPSVMAARVTLSYEPEVATRSDCLHEVFITLFNTVMWRYQKKLEEGTIGDTAFAWLIDATGHALDSANHELNTICIADMIGDNEVSSVIMQALDSVEANFADRAKCSQLMEPIVIEYLVLEQACSKGSFFDRWPKDWYGATFVRGFGFSHIRAKVECLFAYVESHEKTLQTFAGLDRFPGLIVCMKSLISAAKHDLATLEEIYPRRCLYSKHLLLLKIIMGRRLEELMHVVEQGWLQHSDAELLVRAFHKRLACIDHFVPKSRPVNFLKDPGSSSLGERTLSTFGRKDTRGVNFQACKAAGQRVSERKPSDSSSKSSFSDPVSPEPEP